MSEWRRASNVERSFQLQKLDSCCTFERAIPIEKSAITTVVVVEAAVRLDGDSFDRHCFQGGVRYQKAHAARSAQSFWNTSPALEARAPRTESELGALSVFRRDASWSFDYCGSHDDGGRQADREEILQFGHPQRCSTGIRVEIGGR